MCIGLDKIGHFFQQGYLYFIHQHDMKFTPDQIKELGHDTERGMLGLATTGVYSYADLAANAAGHQFYNDVFAGLFSPNPTPKQRLPIREFDICKYLTPALKENPNWFERMIYGAKMNSYCCKAYKQAVEGK